MTLNYLLNIFLKLLVLKELNRDPAYYSMVEQHRLNRCIFKFNEETKVGHIPAKVDKENLWTTT